MNNYKKDDILFICWFRRNLRIHDNILLNEASKRGNYLIPLFIIDPGQITPNLMSVNRIGFLLECIDDLDNTLKKNYNQRLFITYGSPLAILQKITFHIRGFLKFSGRIVLSFEKDFQPYEKVRDSTILQWAQQEQIIVQSGTTQTLWNLDLLRTLNNYQQFKTISEFKEKIKNIKEPLKEIPPPDFLPPPLIELFVNQITRDQITNFFGSIQFFNESPTIEQLGMGFFKNDFKSIFQGGETISLKKMDVYFKDLNSVSRFNKNMENPTKENPNSSTQSPYLAIGCLSVRKFYHKIKKFLSENTDEDQNKVVNNLLESLYWREYFYLVGGYTQNFDKMYNNPVSKLTDCWDYNSTFIESWIKGKTGYPSIDAIINQLSKEGWTHKFNRHLIACFLTRGALWQTWEVGLNFFQKNLIDFDWSINTANWIWLSNSDFTKNYTKVFIYSD